MPENSDYFWMVIVGGIVMIFVAFVIGANDVANSFGTSVGSKALTLLKASILASIFETLGAISLGATVSSTFETKIINLEFFEDSQPTLMLGMITSLVGSLLWLFIATFLGMPVSTTHSIVGGLIGFAIASNHLNSIQWNNLILIAVSWITSPVIAGIFSAILFGSFRSLIFRRKDSIKRGFRYMWILTTFISIIISFFMIYGNPLSFNFPCYQQKDGDLQFISPCDIQYWAASQLEFSIPLAIGLAIVISGVSSIIIYKIARNSIRKFDLLNPKTEEKSIDERFYLNMNKSDNKITIERETNPLFASSLENTNIIDSSSCTKNNINNQSINISTKSSNITDIPYSKSSKKISIIKNLSIDDEINKSMTIKKIHENGEKFNPRIEVFSSSIQTFSACFASLAHGANDVSNAVGPFVTILTVYNHGIVKTPGTSHWILLVCGLSISLGLALYGYKVIKTIGIKMIHMTASRGVCIESATAFTVIIFSKFGIPLSTTYCQVGSIVGVGLTEPRSSNSAGAEWLLGRSVNFKLFIEIFATWILTIVFSGIASALIYLLSSLIFVF